MPLYEYYCAQCNGIFELLRPVRESGDPQPCPVCDRDSKRIMPTEINAFVMRGGLPRRIPDQGLFWTLKGQTTEPEKGKDMTDKLVLFKKNRRESAILTAEERTVPSSIAEPEVRIRKRRGEPRLTRPVKVTARKNGMASGSARSEAAAPASTD